MLCGPRGVRVVVGEGTVAPLVLVVGELVRLVPVLVVVVLVAVVVGSARLVVLVGAARRVVPAAGRARVFLVSRWGR